MVSWRYNPWRMVVHHMYRDDPEKNGSHIKSAQWHARKVCARSVKGLHGLYQALPSASMGNGNMNPIAVGVWSLPPYLLLILTYTSLWTYFELLLILIYIIINIFELLIVNMEVDFTQLLQLGSLFSFTGPSNKVWKCQWLLSVFWAFFIPAKKNQWWSPDQGKDIPGTIWPRSLTPGVGN